MLEQNQEVKKPAQFMLQRVEKQNWQPQETGGKSGGENTEEQSKSRSLQLKGRKGAEDSQWSRRQQERLWAEREEVWSTGEEFKVPLFWKSGSRRSRGAEETARRHTPDSMDVSSAMEKMSIKQTTGGAGGGGRAAMCLICKESCSGFQPHSWRKACTACGCSTVDHAPGNDLEDDQRMGRLLTDSPFSHLTTKIKGGGGLRLYKRNRMIVTNPVVSRKDPTFNTTTYDWAPAGLNQKLAMQYMELLPESQRPVSGTIGALARRRQLLSQLPAYDQDPMKCQSLASEEEISSMLLFVKQYKQEVLGVGEVALPGEGGALSEAAIQRAAKEAKERSSSDKKDAAQHQDHDSSNSSMASSTNGTDYSDKTEYRCTGCQDEVTKESPAVYAERAGYHAALWHPKCFVCSECGQMLADLVYFWSNQKLFCGRHYCQTVWPRCSGCDELIFCWSFLTAKDGQKWHHHHYCCWKCGQTLDAPCQH